jgi:hypothetical protein
MSLQHQAEHTVLDVVKYCTVVNHVSMLHIIVVIRRCGVTQLHNIYIMVNYLLLHIMSYYVVAASAKQDNVDYRTVL